MATDYQVLKLHVAHNTFEEVELHEIIGEGKGMQAKIKRPEMKKLQTVSVRQLYVDVGGKLRNFIPGLVPQPKPEIPEPPIGEVNLG